MATFIIYEPCRLAAPLSTPAHLHIAKPVRESERHAVKMQKRKLAKLLAFKSLNAAFLQGPT